MATIEQVEEIKALMDPQGRVTPRQVVDAARDPSNPLNSHFTWDDSEAAEKHRENEARSLIRTARLQITIETRRFDVQTRVKKVPMFVRDPDSSSGEQGYRHISHLRQDPNASHEAVTAEFARAMAALRRAKKIAVALGTDASDIDDLVLQVAELNSRMAPAPEPDAPAPN